jgi:hypothetical protein
MTNVQGAGSAKIPMTKEPAQLKIPMTKEPNPSQIPMTNAQIPKEDLESNPPLSFGHWSLVIGI